MEDSEHLEHPTWEEPKPMKLYRYKLTGSLHLLEKVDRPEDYEEVYNEQLKAAFGA